MALYGLQGMNGCNEEEVRPVLGALAVKIKESRRELDGQAIGNALYGPQGLSHGERRVMVLGVLGVHTAQWSPFAVF